MERAWSVEDLVGGLWRMGRTDSDTQLQEYLRRVPSGQWPAQGQQTPEQFQQAQAAAYAQAAQAHTVLTSFFICLSKIHKPCTCRQFLCLQFSSVILIKIDFIKITKNLFF